MQQFIERNADHISGALSGFDRILFRGTLRALSYLEGMDKYLNVKGVLYNNFGTFVQRISNKIKDHAAQYAAKYDRPFHYLTSSALSKETFARGSKGDRSRLPFYHMAVANHVVVLLPACDMRHRQSLHKSP